ncbi:hypothetical protein ACQP2E_02030 [Actinoplanes sp. CA-015351]|uniref:hypothetical protein n=1 Tax=Actinoplanes sp. CA-015351 TaxID=3239897 RepID=UPI003D989024
MKPVGAAADISTGPFGACVPCFTHAVGAGWAGVRHEVLGSETSRGAFHAAVGCSAAAFHGWGCSGTPLQEGGTESGTVSFQGGEAGADQDCEVLLFQDSEVLLFQDSATSLFHGCGAGLCGRLSTAGVQEREVLSFQPAPGSTACGDAGGQAPGALAPSAAHESRPLRGTPTFGRSQEACAPPGSAGGAGQAACAPPGSPEGADGDQSSGIELGSGTSAGQVAGSPWGVRG